MQNRQATLNRRRYNVTSVRERVLFHVLEVLTVTYSYQASLAVITAAVSPHGSNARLQFAKTLREFDRIFLGPRGQSKLEDITTPIKKLVESPLTEVYKALCDLEDNNCYQQPISEVSANYFNELTKKIRLAVAINKLIFNHHIDKNLPMATMTTIENSLKKVMGNFLGIFDSEFLEEQLEELNTSLSKRKTSKLKRATDYNKEINAIYSSTEIHKACAKATNSNNAVAQLENEKEKRNKIDINKNKENSLNNTINNSSSSLISYHRDYLDGYRLQIKSVENENQIQSVFNEWTIELKHEIEKAEKEKNNKKIEEGIIFAIRIAKKEWRLFFLIRENTYDKYSVQKDSKLGGILYHKDCLAKPVEDLSDPEHPEKNPFGEPLAYLIRRELTDVIDRYLHEESRERVFPKIDYIRFHSDDRGLPYWSSSIYTEWGERTIENFYHLLNIMYHTCSMSTTTSALLQFGTGLKKNEKKGVKSSLDSSHIGLFSYFFHIMQNGEVSSLLDHSPCFDMLNLTILKEKVLNTSFDKILTGLYKEGVYEDIICKVQKGEKTPEAGLEIFVKKLVGLDINKAGGELHSIDFIKPKDTKKKKEDELLVDKYKEHFRIGLLCGCSSSTTSLEIKINDCLIERLLYISDLDKNFYQDHTGIVRNVRVKEIIYQLCGAEAQLYMLSEIPFRYYIKNDKKERVGYEKSYDETYAGLEIVWNYFKDKYLFVPAKKVELTQQKTISSPVTPSRHTTQIASRDSLDASLGTRYPGRNVTSSPQPATTARASIPTTASVSTPAPTPAPAFNTPAPAPAPTSAPAFNPAPTSAPTSALIASTTPTASKTRATAANQQLTPVTQSPLAFFSSQRVIVAGVAVASVALAAFYKFGLSE